MDDPQARRVAHNETAHRELNERLAEYDSQAGFASLPLEFVCECYRRECHEHLELTADTWQRLHPAGDLFVVAPGHVDPQHEDVLLRTSAYWHVRKRGEAGEIARELDGNGKAGERA
jgi:hypothetical protein